MIRQFAKFGLVGLVGYGINLAVYTFLVHQGGLHYLEAAPLSFLVAVANNYVFNRCWTFREARGHFGTQGARFLAVSLVALGVNLAVLALLVALGASKDVAQAAAILTATPVNFAGNKLWSFRGARRAKPSLELELWAARFGDPSLERGIFRGGP